MLNSAFLAVALFIQQGTAPQAPIPPTAKSVIEKMLMRYASAKSLNGTVKLTQSAQNVSVVTDTTVAYERPSKILVFQKRGGSQPRSSILVSNGEKFFFTKPEQIVGASDYMGELVKPDDRPAQTVGDLYAIAAADLPDRSPSLDILIGRATDLKYCVAQFKTIAYKGKVSLGDRSVHQITGHWKQNQLRESDEGEFEMYITDDGDLVRYVLHQKYAIPDQPAENSVEVTNTWDTAVSVNAPVKPETFALRTH